MITRMPTCHTTQAPRVAALSLAALLLVIQAGCSSWPDAGQGGDVPIDTSRQYYLDQIDDWIGVRPESKGALETQWGIHNLKLDTLILRGARECIPARVREVTLMSQRARRELDGSLLEDARNSLVIMHREVDELERRLVYIKRHTACPQTRVAQYSQAQQRKNDVNFRFRYAKYMLGFLLNQDNAFATDSDQLSPLYREHLLVASRYLNEFPQLRLRLNGHTDSRASYDYNQDLSLRRARHVKQQLVAMGIDEQRMQVRAFGEHLPRASNSSWTGRLKNRRVHIEVLEPEQTLDALYLEMDAQFGFNADQKANKSADKAARQVKHWHIDSRHYEVPPTLLNDEFSYSYFDDFQQRRPTPGE